jgi:hypothetical protein
MQRNDGWSSCSGVVGRTLTEVAAGQPLQTRSPLF